MKVVDNRAKTIKRVQNIELGKAFMTNSGEVFIRVACEYDVDMGFNDELLVLDSTGEVVGMNKDIIVEPIKLELWIVD